MAQFAKHEAIVEMDAADGSTLTDYSGDIKSVNMSGTFNGSQYHTLDSLDAKALTGGRNVTVEITYVNDNTATEFAGVIRAWVLASTKPPAKSLQIQMPDDSSGSTQLACEVLPGGNFSVADIVAGGGENSELTITLNVTGAVTVTTIS